MLFIIFATLPCFSKKKNESNCEFFELFFIHIFSNKKTFSKIFKLFFTKFNFKNKKKNIKKKNMVR